MTENQTSAQSSRSLARRQEMIEAMIDPDKMVYTATYEYARVEAERVLDAQQQHLSNHPDPNERALGEAIKSGIEGIECPKCQGFGKFEGWVGNAGDWDEQVCPSCNGSGTLYRIGKSDG